MIMLFFRKRINEFLKNKKIFIFKLVLPSILLLPLFFTPANIYLIATATTFLIVIFGFFGAGESLGRERANGSLQRTVISPISPFKVVVGEILAHSLLEFFQFLPILVLIFVKIPSIPALLVLPAYLFSLFCTIFSANILGILMIPIFPEFRTVVFLTMIFPLMIFSGVFVSLKSWSQIAIAKFLPPSYLYQSTLLIFGKESIFSSWEVIVLSLLPTLFILILAAAFSEKIIR